MNILEGGYSSIDSLFIISPWVFMFLIPAITMRMFADEKKAGTLELLITRPLTDLQIILAKYFAGVVLVILSLIPTLIYYISVYYLGNPVGNIDSGGTFGSYIGLLLLGASYVAIGLFASSLTDNQIVSFIISMILCFIMFYLFDQVASFKAFEGIDYIILKFGINEHFNSLSRGVIDSRDLLYFGSLIGFFILLTKIRLESRKW